MTIRELRDSHIMDDWHIIITRKDDGRGVSFHGTLGDIYVPAANKSVELPDFVLDKEIVKLYRLNILETNSVFIQISKRDYDEMCEELNKWAESV